MNITILFISFILYFYRLSTINNCLFRKNSENIIQFQPLTIIYGMFYPFKLLYLAINYLKISDILIVLKESIFTVDNIFFNIIILHIFAFFI